MTERRFLAPMSERVLNRLIGHFLVALAGDDVDRRLAADELRQRRHHDRIAEVGAHPPRFFQSFLQAIFHAHGAQLMAQIGNHAAGHLMQILRVIVFALRADRVAFALGDVSEMLFNRFDRFEIDERLNSRARGRWRRC